MEQKRAAKQQWLSYYQLEIDKEKLPILLATGASAALQMLVAVPVLLLGNTIGSTRASVNTKSTQMALVAAALLIILAIVRAACVFYASTNKQRIANMATQLFQQNILAHIFRLPANIKQEKPDEVYLQSITEDSVTAASSLIEAPVKLTRALVTLATAGAILLFIDAKLLVAMAIILPLTYTTIRGIKSVASAHERDLNSFKDTVARRLRSTIALSAYIQIWNREQKEIQAVKDVQHALLNESQLSAQEMGLYRGVTDLLRLILAALVFCLVPIMALGKGGAIGDVFAAALILLMTVQPLEDIQSAIAEHQVTKTATDRIFTILHDLPEYSINPNAVTPVSVAGNLRFNNVSLTLHDQQVIKNLSFDVPAKQSLAISGQTLQPLSAALTCIPLLIYYNEGSITIDEIDNRTMALPVLHQSIAYLGYRPRFLPLSVADNVAIQTEHPDQALLAAALGKAGVYEAVQALPNGLNTILDDQMLGQISHSMQIRLTVARAFMANAPILLMEEPLQDFSDDDKRRVLPVLHELIQGRTTLMVTRDRELLTLAQRVLVLRDNALQDVAEYGGLDAFRDSLE